MNVIAVAVPGARAAAFSAGPVLQASSSPAVGAPASSAAQGLVSALQAGSSLSVPASWAHARAMAATIGVGPTWNPVARPGDQYASRIGATATASDLTPSETDATLVEV